MSSEERAGPRVGYMGASRDRLIWGLRHGRSSGGSSRNNSCVTLLNCGVSYAADKITLTCSGFYSRNDAISPIHDEVCSFVIDLDRNVVSFGYSIATGAGDDIPITKVADNYIWFEKNQALSNNYWKGQLD